MNDQLVLDFGLKVDKTFDSFYFAENKVLANQLSALELSFPGVLLWGTQGCGKSHLLNAVCVAFQNRYPDKAIAYIPFQTDESEHAQEFPCEILQGLENCDLVCLDNLDGIFGDYAWEQATFHLFNRLKDSQVHLLVSISKPLASYDFSIPDLQSRLASLTTFELKALRDDDLFHALTLGAEQRAIKLDKEVLNYLSSRGPRNMVELNRLLDRLDEESLKAKRNITVPFLKQFVNW